ncbi:hypothetical protein MSAN_01098700 [Mycena sanguinolenta]|uniref:Uncharacterized protein n=1 Tax=Mycena sanguinolenta TaxID=230812 RepID=A0A8H6YNI5_9AGAR|nr:hypothetical protein MSAN_01098700 [Mycena sanguinolenta]
MMPSAKHNRRLRPRPRPPPSTPLRNPLLSPTPSQSRSPLAQRARPLPEALPKSLPAASPGLVSEVSSIIDELHAILKTLSLEDPRGSENIYGMDTSIMWGSEDLEWCNSGPAGCSGGKIMLQAGEEKARFKRAVDIVSELVESAERQG